MGIRTNLEIILQLGRNNALSDLLINESLTALLDTLDHATVHEATLAAGESNYVVPFGDVAQARLVYVRANGPIRLTPGGGLATSAIVTAVGGGYPTGFSGGEELVLDIDDIGQFTTTFDAADQSLAAVVNRINAAAALVPVVDGAGDPVAVARASGGQLQLRSSTTGTGSEVEVVSGSAGVLATLGLTADVTNGVAASPGQTPVTLTKPAYVTASNPAADVPVFALLTLQTSGLTIDSLDGDDEVRLLVAIAGDVLTEPPSSC